MWAGAPCFNRNPEHDHKLSHKFFAKSRISGLTATIFKASTKPAYAVYERMRAGPVYRRPADPGGGVAEWLKAAVC